ncbi:MAG: hypothetical protein HRU70_14775 [Phycisphaeraceae bacterium]|nr:MAG: hypothetical protein HRU70_14775 [Phycisphaeraceae bacterium]
MKESRWSLVAGRWSVVMALAAVSLLAADRARAADHRPGRAVVRLGDWSVTPLVRDGAGVGREVRGFLALKDPSAVVGDNLASVWFVRGEGGSWSAYSWPEPSHWTAIETVKSLLHIGDGHDGVWPTSEPRGGGAAPAMPEVDVFGVLAGDPFADSVESAGPSRASLVTALVELGHAASGVPLSGAYFAGEGGEHEYAPMSVSGCDEEETLEALALAIEQAGCEDWGEGCEEAVGQMMGQACGWLCWPKTIEEEWLPLNPGTYTPESWVYVRTVFLGGSGVQCWYERWLKRPVKRRCIDISTLCNATVRWEYAEEWVKQEDYCDMDNGPCPSTPSCLDGVPPSPRPQDDEPPEYHPIQL